MSGDADLFRILYGARLDKQKSANFSTALHDFILQIGAASRPYKFPDA